MVRRVPVHERAAWVDGAGYRHSLRDRRRSVHARVARGSRQLDRAAGASLCLADRVPESRAAGRAELPGARRPPAGHERPRLPAGAGQSRDHAAHHLHHRARGHPDERARNEGRRDRVPHQAFPRPGSARRDPRRTRTRPRTVPQLGACFGAARTLRHANQKGGARSCASWSPAGSTSRSQRSSS